MSESLPTAEQLRQAGQLALVASSAEFEVGTREACPLPPERLAALRGDEPFVVQRFGSGLTAEVYRLRLDGAEWTLKRARTTPLVRNVDGQTSFLNELQRRADFARLKAAGATGLEAIVDTVYGSLRLGVLVSPWIEGRIVRDWDERRLAQVIGALVACHANGLFEWDPSPGNVLDDGRQLRLFDFGYMYRFDPLVQFNSAGGGTDAPQFHPVERFETRNFIGWLLALECRLGAAAALAQFRVGKEVALHAYRRLRADLATRGGSRTVLDWLDAIIARWNRALAGDLAALYLAEAWRSHTLDLDDDLRGASCTPQTLERADWLIDALRRHHDALAAADAFDGGDRTLGRQTLLERYGALRRRAEALQVAPR